jgi:uncharacterized protein
MKTVCIYHSIDLDGWMSAAIVKHWFIKNNKEYFITNEEQGLTDKNSIGFGNQLHFIGYNYGQPIPDLSEYDKVIMCDISFPKEEMSKLNMKLGYDNFIWIDHHISAIKDYHSLPFEKRMNDLNGIQDTKFAACELAWEYFFPDEEMPEIVRLLGRYDCFGHKGTDEEQKVLEFQYGARQIITNYEEAYKELSHSLEFGDNFKQLYHIFKNGKAIYQYLCTEAKQIYESGFEIELYSNPLDEVHPIINTHKFICINNERFNPINFDIDYHNEGYDGAACFHYEGVSKLWKFSLYNDNGLVDCSVIAKQYGGGGHKGAAGFAVKNLSEIIK